MTFWCQAATITTTIQKAIISNQRRRRTGRSNPPAAYLGVGGLSCDSSSSGTA